MSDLKLTASELAKYLDHSVLRPECGHDDYRDGLAEALEYKTASLCVTPAWTRWTAMRLAGSEVKCCAVVGFPHGTSKSTVKAIEATSVIKDGAEEVDVVANIGHLAAMDLDASRAELQEIVRAAKACRRDVLIKVIVESALLEKLQEDKFEQVIELACRAVRESGCDYIKTSTGFHPAGGASVRAVSLMKKHAGSLKVKASGGIRDTATALAMILAGADRVGTSSTAAIIKGSVG